ncbi:MAG: proton-conducting transporter membrane subunit [Endomicrobiales bacterium]|jgi:hydrogenase-4 component B
MDYLRCGYTPLFDHLSQLFLILIVLVSLPSAVYSYGYFRHEYAQKKLQIAWVLLGGFIISLGLVVCAGNIISFLVAWELMALISWLLVIFDSHQARAVKAGTIYLVMTHAATACIVAGFCMLYCAAGSFDLVAMRLAARAMTAHQRDVLFLLFFAGFGTKAGLVPAHLWLPYAHPQAPSPVSGIMSGAMVKMGIYGIVRFIFDILGVSVAWWGIALLAVAAVSMLTGAMYSLLETDIKKILAYSTIENVGIIVMGIGISALCSVYGFPQIAVLALAAALFHALNHAVFKNLLFLAAGAVAAQTHTRNIEYLGGLIRKMPWTAGLFLVGSAASAALPPLNGFASEWLILQSLIIAAIHGPALFKLLSVAGIVVLALTGGLAAAGSVRMFGITFLGRARTPAGDGALDASRVMKMPMIVLALSIVALGVGAVPVFRYLTVVAANLLHVDISSMHVSLTGAILCPHTVSGPFLSPLLILCVLAISAGSVLLFVRRTAVERGKTWGCGYYQLSPRTQFSATAFSKPFRSAFGFFLMPSHRTQTIKESPYFVKSIRYDVRTTFIFKKYLYQAGYGAVMSFARRMKWIQAGNIQLYIAYILITMIILLVLTL